VRRPGRAVPLLNGGIATGLVLLLAAVAVVVNPPAPPGISEFAPQATKPISKAPLGQTSVRGSGPDSCVPGQPCAARSGPEVRSGTPVPRPRGISAAGVPSELQCYTWPDGSVTQTFDPQSPPCIASWPDAAKGNGGTTSRGVSATTIRIGFPTQTDLTDWVVGLSAFFNQHYQFYGRKIQMVPLKEHSRGYGTPTEQHADALAMSKLNVFAALDYRLNNGALLNQTQYFRDLAKARIIAVNGGSDLQTSAHYRERAPYLWNYALPFDVVERALGEVVCKQLVGKMASRSVQFRGASRKFGVLVPSTRALGQPSPKMAELRDALRTCGIEPRTGTYEVGNADAPTNAQLMASWQSDGITTILFLANSDTTNVPPMSAASSVGYHPEWVVSGATRDEEEERYWGSLAPKDQLAGLFGVATWSRPLPSQDEPVARADGRAKRPTYWTPDLQRPIYRELLLLAAGIQAAGPGLTPQSFTDGLQQTDFPNPGAGSRPSYQEHVGFSDAKQWMVDDLALAWWNATGSRSNGQDQTSGIWCFVEAGQRWRPGDFPTKDRFFDTDRSLC